MTPRRALWSLIAASSVLRIAWAASLGAGNDEAYFYLYTRNPDWSYFDHPPMVSWLETIGTFFSGGVTGILALRMPFIVLFGASTWLMARLTTRFYGAWAGVLAAFLLTVAGYFGLGAGSFALPDGPLIFFWLLTLDRIAVAWTSRPARHGRLGTWAWVGLAWGGALLSKYHAALLPIGVAVFLAAEPRARVWLRQPGPYLALAIGLMIFAPVIGWNAAHGWASFAFQGGRALSQHAWPRLERLVVVLLGQALYVFPWIWLVLIVALARVVRGWLGRRSALSERFLVIQSLVPLSMFLIVGCWSTLLPHWSLVSLLTLIPLAARDGVEALARARPRAVRRLAAWGALTVVTGWLIAVQTRTGLLQDRGRGSVGLLPVSRDPTIDLYGWQEVARAIKHSGLMRKANSYLFTSKWYHSGQLALAMGPDVPVLCYSARAALGFGQWSRPEQWVGRNGILAVVNHSSTEPAAYERWFERIEPIGSVTIQRAGTLVRIVKLYHCIRQTRSFPFAGPDKMEVEAESTPQIAHRSREYDSSLAPHRR